MNEGPPTEQDQLPTGPLTPAQVADRLGVSRRSVMRAIDAKELKAFRDNKNHWKVNPEDLDAWAKPLAKPLAKPPAKPKAPPSAQEPPNFQAVTAALEAEIVALREQIGGLEADLSAQTVRATKAEAALEVQAARAGLAEDERERWREMVAKFADRPAPPEPAPRRPFWPWVK